MNITFLVGNGFDRNLGLKTTYAEFVKEYKKEEPETDNLKKFKDHINENEELWSSAEEALGLYTEKLDNGKAEVFSECHLDICEKLAVYLKNQQARINYAYNEEHILEAMSRLNSIQRPFPSQEREPVNTAFSSRNNEIRVFNFICFNYTNTLEQCLDCVKGNSAVLGNHKNGSSTISHSIGKLCHVHGTVDKEMVFGVNDESQIANLELFDCENGDLYRNLLIKQRANASYLENTDAHAAQILKDSHIIYIYGMSIGKTDKLWWDRICTWLKASGDRHLILQKHSLPAKGVFPIKYQLAERECRRMITQYCDFDDTTKRNIEQRIHVTDDNLFGAMKDIARNQPEDMAKEIADSFEQLAASLSPN